MKCPYCFKNFKNFKDIKNHCLEFCEEVKERSIDVFIMDILRFNRERNYYEFSENKKD